MENYKENVMALIYSIMFEKAPEVAFCYVGGNKYCHLECLPESVEALREMGWSWERERSRWVWGML